MFILQPKPDLARQLSVCLVRDSREMAILEALRACAADWAHVFSQTSHVNEQNLMLQTFTQPAQCAKTGTSQENEFRKWRESTSKERETHESVKRIAQVHRSDLADLPQKQDLSMSSQADLDNQPKQKSTSGL